MKAINIILLVSLVLTIACTNEICFDENTEINRLVKTAIDEFAAKEFNSGPSSFVMTIKRINKADTLEFVISLTSSILVFAEDSVYFRAEYLDKQIFTNYRNKSFRDSCSIKEAAQYLDNEELQYYTRTGEIPPPFQLWTVSELKLAFHDGKLVEKRYFFLH